jgi:uncharacterized protein (TIGR01777 family)
MNSESKTILVTGASGLVGKSLCVALEARGHTVRRLSRSKNADYVWDIDRGYIDPTALKNVDVVIHLAGETVAQRWSEAAKQRILNSRTRSTALLVTNMLKQPVRPALISASGISYYGIQRENDLSEDATTGGGFLAEVTRQWEGAAQPLLDADVRVAFLRTGIVLSKQGGALAKMLTPFKLGVGGRIGSGRQKMSWISLVDLVNAYIFSVENESVSGAINAVAPEPVTNKVFTKTLGFVIGRPTIFPLPSKVVELLFGEMGEETVLGDLGVIPARLTALKFEWEQPELEDALRRTIYDL